MTDALRTGVAIALTLAVATALVPASAARPSNVTNRCPTAALPLRESDLPALRRAGLEAAPQGVHQATGGRRAIDYRGARASAAFPTFYSGYVRTACSKRDAARVLKRTADVHIGYPRVNWSASLSSSTFLVARTSKGFVVWAQMH